ncbi:MAG: SDR family NAD(P)-dependent oxidoreductase [Myxococcota bacterium]
MLPVVCDVRDRRRSRISRSRRSPITARSDRLQQRGRRAGRPVLETTPADWRWIVDVNVLGVAYGVLAFGPILKQQGEGHIINTASEAGHVSSAMLGMYTATKHAVVGLSESLYRELRARASRCIVSARTSCARKIFHSERNRDDGAEIRPSQTATMAPLREAISAMGIAPEQVAGDIVDAMRADRFWIFTHPTTRRSLAVRYADIGSRPQSVESVCEHRWPRRPRARKRVKS